MTDTRNVYNTDWMFEPGATDQDKARILWHDKTLQLAISEGYMAVADSHRPEIAQKYQSLSETADHTARVRGMQAFAHFMRFIGDRAPNDL